MSQGIPLQVTISGEDVQKQVAAAILDSALGKEIQKSIERVIPQVTQGWNSALEEVIKREVNTIVTQLVNKEFRDQITTAVRSKLTKERIDDLTSKFIDNLSISRY